MANKMKSGPFSFVEVDGFDSHFSNSFCQAYTMQVDVTSSFELLSKVILQEYFLQGVFQSKQFVMVSAKKQIL